MKFIKTTESNGISQEAERLLEAKKILEKLDGELEKELAGIDIEQVEKFLSAIYRLQAQVLDPSYDTLFILWEEFKHQHEAIFAKATAVLARRKLDQSGVPVGAIICIPSGASWMEESFRQHFPEAQHPMASKDLSKLSVGEHIVLDSLTYTKRTASGKRLPVQILLEKYDTNRGVTLIIEDILATGNSMQEHFSGFRQLGVGGGELVVVAVVSMDVQKGISAVARDDLVNTVFAPIRVTGVSGEGYGKIKTLK